MLGMVRTWALALGVTGLLLSRGIRLRGTEREDALRGSVQESDAMTKKQRKREHAESAIQLRGMFRVQLKEQDGRISGDSGWVQNRVVNLGMKDYILTPLAGGASKPVQ